MPPAIRTSVSPTAITVSAGIWLASVVNVRRREEVIGRRAEEQHEHHEHPDQAEVLGEPSRVPGEAHDAADP